MTSLPPPPSKNKRDSPKSQFKTQCHDNPTHKERTSLSIVPLPPPPAPPPRMDGVETSLETTLPPHKEQKKNHAHIIIIILTVQTLRLLLLHPGAVNVMMFGGIVRETQDISVISCRSNNNSNSSSSSSSSSSKSTLAERDDGVVVVFGMQQPQSQTVRQKTLPVLQRNFRFYRETQ
jgi:hypothetical protein